MSFQVFSVFFAGLGLVLFFLAAPAKLHHRVAVAHSGQPPYEFLPRHALRSPHRDARQFFRGKLNLCKLKILPARRRRYILSAARIFALRDRGFRSISSSDAVTGFFVSNRKFMSFAPARIASFTIRSSSE